MGQERPDDEYVRMMNGIRLQEAAELCERSRALRARARRALTSCENARRRAQAGLRRSEITMSLLTEYLDTARKTQR